MTGSWKKKLHTDGEALGYNQYCHLCFSFKLFQCR